MSSHYQSFSYSFYSSSTSTNGGPPQRTTYAERSYTDDRGTLKERLRKLPGQLPVYESTEQPGGSRVEGSSAQNRITDVTDSDKKYEERMEDEYAKREGGA
ncbi:hypothetical protein HD806DRAFT_486682 [Xylariaceae sp. AK1471]|nr:hypothetical protein HD806DRAFT_486682 [Xylariaceae sp. AK1471]